MHGYISAAEVFYIHCHHHLLSESRRKPTVNKTELKPMLIQRHI
jgi:hypothetical protein